jgi:hypothetical protein
MGMSGQVNFGAVLQALAQGRCARRAGWNGKRMFIYKLQVTPQTVAYEAADDTVISFAPTFCLFTAQGVHQPGWNAAQPDMMALDWEILSADEVRECQAR